MKLSVVGDEATLAGWRLIGARTYSPAPREAQHALREALAEADMVIITASYAAQVPPTQLDAALHEGKPPVLVITDAANTLPPPDLQAAIQRTFGVAR